MNGAKSEEKSLSVSCLPNTKRAATQDLADDDDGRDPSCHQLPLAATAS